MKLHGKPEPINSAILKFIDSVYEEILALEHEHGMQIGGRDLRVPIEYYHDVIRLLTSNYHLHSQRLSIESLSNDLARLRKHTEWIGSGGHVFLHNQDFDAAHKLKRVLLIHANSLQINPVEMFNELVEFARLYKPQGDYEKLQEVLNSRFAEKSHTGSGGHARFTTFPAAEFWKGMELAMREFGEIERDYDNTIEFRAGNKSIKKLRHQKESSDEIILNRVTDSVKFFWVQIVHPLLLLKCVGGDPENFEKHPPVFNPAKFIDEARWQKMEAAARGLKELYANYTVLFAAVVKDTVDRDFKALVENMDEIVSEAADIKQIIEELINQNALEFEDIEQISEQCQNEDIKKQVMLILHQMQQQKQQKRNAEIEGDKIIKKMEEMMHAADVKITATDKAHFNFLANQLMVYQSSTEMIKKLAEQGLNIAGKFVEQAAAAGVSRGGPKRGR